MPTVSELIHSSMRLIGAIASGETMETAELNDAFVSLNQMISSWNTEGLSLAGRRRLTVNITININQYILQERPIHIDAASVATQMRDCPLEIVDAAGWEAIAEKNMLAVEIKKLWCDYSGPTPSVFIWPSPRAAGLLELIVFDPILPFTDVNQTVNLPPGYEAALRFTLAMNLAPEYGRPVDQLVAAEAQNFKASLVQLNASNHARTAQPTLATVAAQGAS